MFATCVALALVIKNNQQSSVSELSYMFVFKTTRDKTLYNQLPPPRAILRLFIHVG